MCRLFSTIRTSYSLFNDRHHRSGHLEEGDGDGDNYFFVTFARRVTVYLYAHKLFKARPLKFCTRDSNQNFDVGVSGYFFSNSMSSLYSPKERGT